MSRINDALKRAGRVHRPPHSRFQPGPESSPSSLPVPPNPAPSSSSLRLAIIGAALIVVAFAGWAVHEWRGMARRLSEITEQDKQLAMRPTEPVLPTAIPITPITAPPLELVPVREETVPAATPLELPTTVQVQVFPPLKLQGVFFSRKNPSVLINGKNRALGETIDGVRITKIEQEKVTVEWNGASKTLSIGR